MYLRQEAGRLDIRDAIGNQTVSTTTRKVLLCVLNEPLEFGDALDDGIIARF
jgi:hypothetical protein